MQAKRRATVEDLWHVEEKAELVDGEIVRMSPSGGRHGFADGEIFASLRDYARRSGKGYALGDSVGFIVDLPNRQSFSPDVAFHVGELTNDFVRGAPIFAVEIRSKDDFGAAAEARMAAKRADYFAARSIVVWNVDTIRGECVRIFRAPDPLNPTVRTRTEIADAEPALPGWSMRVGDLFPRG